MKRILLLGLVSALFLSSCDKYIEGFDKSPNLPGEVSNANLLLVSGVATQSNYTGHLARMQACFIQQCSGIAFQYADLEAYVVTENDMDNLWNGIYADGAINAQTLIKQAGAGNPWYAGMAKVLKAMNLALASDMWGNVPLREALRGIEGPAYFNPAYDNQQQIYNDLQALLSEAIVDLKKPASANLLRPNASDDVFFGGDAASWVKVAWMLKARLAIHLTKRNGNNAATQANAFLDSANLSGNGDNMIARWGSRGNELNPWYSFNLTRGGYLKMGKPFVDRMLSTNDPRLPFFATTEASGGYSGTEANSGVDTTSDVGNFVAGASATNALVTYAEMMFIKAEAEFRLGNGAAAATAFNAAVKASILEVTGSSNPTFEAANANETATTITLEKILTQKNTALFSQIEAFNDWRRTGIPAVTPAAGAALSAVPRRLPTPLNERVNNRNASVVSDLLSRVWWDQ